MDLHINGERQGPGSDKETRKALDMTLLDQNAPLKIADIGCGTGASTMALKRMLKNSRISSVDLFSEFLDVLNRNALQEGFSEDISTIACSMDNLPFQDDEFDLIWSEGAVYNIGFENGLSKWRRYLKPEGVIAVSEITWLTSDRPDEIHNHWKGCYPEIGTASDKIRIIEKNGYSPIGYFTLPEYCWLDNYYLPLEKRFDDFLQKYKNSKEALEIVESEKEEIDLYKVYSAFFGYGFYIAKKI